MINFAKKAVIIVLLLFVLPQSHAATGYSVRQLLTQCLSEPDLLTGYEPQCSLFIRGFVSALNYYNISADFCPGTNGYNLPDIRREFVRWAVYHSEHYDEPASTGLVQVLHSLYACDG